MNTEALGGRKFILAVITLIFVVGLMWFGKISDGVFSTIIITTMGMYIGGNVTQKIKTDEKATAETKVETKPS